MHSESTVWGAFVPSRCYRDVVPDCEYTEKSYAETTSRCKAEVPRGFRRPVPRAAYLQEEVFYDVRSHAQADVRDVYSDNPVVAGERINSYRVFNSDRLVESVRVPHGGTTLSDKPAHASYLESSEGDAGNPKRIPMDITYQTDNDLALVELKRPIFPAL